MTISFAHVIRNVAYLCGAVAHDGTPSAVTGTTLADANDLSGYDNSALIGRRVYIYEGPGIGQERRITASTGASSLITVVTWDANPVVAASRYIVLHDGWRIDHFRTAFLNAMRALRRSYLIPKVDESITLSAGVYEYALPSGFAAVEKVVRERNDGLSDFNWPFPNDTWYINKDSTRELVIEKEAVDALSNFFIAGYAIRLVGQAYETEPDDDSDTLSIPTGVLEHLAASNALTTARVRDVNNNQGFGQLASIRYQEWLKLRSDVDDETRVNPGSKRVDE